MLHRQLAAALGALVALAASAQLIQEFPVSNGIWLEKQPSISFLWVVWADNRDAGTSGFDIWGQNLAADHPSPICQDSYDQVHPDVNVWGKTIDCVWEDYRTKNSPDIWGVLPLGTKPLAITDFPGYETLPKCWGNTVVYENSELPVPPTGADIWAYDIAKATNFPVAAAYGPQVTPDIDGYAAVWADDRPSVMDNRWDIYAMDIRTMEEKNLTNSLQFDQQPAISGDWVVYQTQTASGEWDIMAKRLSDPTASPVPICTAPGNQTNPAIWGNIVVWEDARKGAPRIWGYDLAAGQEFQVSTPLDPKYDLEPDVSQNVVVWTRYMDIGPLYQSDVYGAYLNFSNIAGTVELKDYPGDIQAVPMELELMPADPPGTTALAIRLAPDGSFFATTLVEGLYFISLKPSHWLRQRLASPVQLQHGQTVSVKFSLTNGDAWPDNRVNLLDLSTVLHYFGHMSPDLGDLSGDGYVDVLDLAIILRNFGKVGD